VKEGEKMGKRGGREKVNVRVVLYFGINFGKEKIKSNEFIA